MLVMWKSLSSSMLSMENRSQDIKKCEHTDLKIGDKNEDYQFAADSKSNPLYYALKPILLGKS